MKLAVLIDADNISASGADEIFDIAEKLGEVITRRAFGNLTVFAGKDGWKEPVRKHAIQAFPQVNNIDRKNTADFALIIDAMDCLYSGHYDGFILVSSDSDFTSLAQRIRNEDKAVYGIGDDRAPASFRKACTKFFEITSEQSKTAEPVTSVPVTSEPVPEKKVPEIVQQPAASSLPEPQIHVVQETVSKVKPVVSAPVSSGATTTDFQVIVGMLQGCKCKNVDGIRQCLINNSHMSPQEADRFIQIMKSCGIISIDIKGDVNWLVGPLKANPPSEFQRIVSCLEKMKCKKKEGMQNYLMKTLKKSTAETERIIKAMVSRGFISIDENNKVTWLKSPFVDLSTKNK